MARTHCSQLLAIGIALALSACNVADEPYGGVESKPTRVTAASPAPTPVPAPPAPPAPPPDYTGTPCATLPAIATPPTMVGKPSNDPAYEAIKAAGAGAVPCLVEALADTRPLDRAQSMPGGQGDFTRGDLAFFLLVDFGHVDFMRVLPPDVAARVPARGAFAYFDWIVVPGSRERLQARVREELGATAAAAPVDAPLRR